MSLDCDLGDTLGFTVGVSFVLKDAIFFLSKVEDLDLLSLPSKDSVLLCRGEFLGRGLGPVLGESSDSSDKDR